MPTRPSHPSDARDDGRNTITATSDGDGAVIVLAAHGDWDWRLFRDLYTWVRKCLVEHPVALIVDLRDLTDPTTASASLWLTARRRGAAMRPPVEVALCLAPRTPLARRLHSMGARRFLPLYDTVPQARTAVVSGLPLTDRLQQQLPPEPKSAKLARLMVADACAAWHLAHLLTPAQLIISELVANAILHARTDMVVTISRRGTGLNLTVLDCSPTLPRPPRTGADGEPPAESGRGLQIVNAAATAWGALLTHDGDGKIVWATVR